MNTGRALLADWLRKSHTNQRDFAQKVGISDGYLSQILAGLRRPKLELLTLIEHLTGVPVSSWVDKRRGNSDLPSNMSAK